MELFLDTLDHLLELLGVMAREFGAMALEKLTMTKAFGEFLVYLAPAQALCCAVDTGEVVQETILHHLLVLSVGLLAHWLFGSSGSASRVALGLEPSDLSAIGKVSRLVGCFACAALLELLWDTLIGDIVRDGSP